jgi:hypothetical protein
MSLERTIIDAIEDKKMLQFNYHRYVRIVEPHVYGVKDGKKSLQAYQVGGESSSGGLPQWRRFFLDDLSDIETLNDGFSGKRDYPSGIHSSFDEIIKLVD